MAVINGGAGADGEEVAAGDEGAPKDNRLGYRNFCPEGHHDYLGCERRASKLRSGRQRRCTRGRRSCVENWRKGNKNGEFYQNVVFEVFLLINRVI